MRKIRLSALKQLLPGTPSQECSGLPGCLLPQRQLRWGKTKTHIIFRNHLAIYVDRKQGFAFLQHLSLGMELWVIFIIFSLRLFDFSAAHMCSFVDLKFYHSQPKKLLSSPQCQVLSSLSLSPSPSHPGQFTCGSSCLFGP